MTFIQKLKNITNCSQEPELLEQDKVRKNLDLQSKYAKRKQAIVRDWKPEGTRNLKVCDITEVMKHDAILKITR